MRTAEDHDLWYKNSSPGSNPVELLVKSTPAPAPSPIEVLGKSIFDSDTPCAEQRHQNGCRNCAYHHGRPNQGAAANVHRVDEAHEKDGLRFTPSRSKPLRSCPLQDRGQPSNQLKELAAEVQHFLVIRQDAALQRRGFAKESKS
ncbi:hypothetical protein RB195_024127 [Necator americanus]|uniref:Uncharacterized protein n=1 Tax=Necator americanus TaxID=51031 RepID=A0ABR1EP65_NECAM